MKQWLSDKENPDNVKEREQIMKKRANVKQKQSKKMSIGALAKWHEIPLNTITKKR